MAVPRRMRFEVLRRDNHTCRYCGAKAPEVTLTVDHVVPTALGGRDEPSNLVAACLDCNAGKASVAPGAPLVDDVVADALRWGRAMEAAALLRRTDQEEVDRRVGEVQVAWHQWGVSVVEGTVYRSSRFPAETVVPLPDDWPRGVALFVEAGLDEEDLDRFVEVAMMARHVPVEAKWAYFCGCAWRELDRRQALARRLLDDGAV